MSYWPNPSYGESNEGTYTKLSYGDVDLIGKQQSLARKKDVVTPWFGEWNDVNGTAWQQAIMGKVTVEQALNTSATKWTELKKQS